MTCNISNPFNLITICLVVPGKECRFIFKDVAQGHFSWDGWQLQVQGCTAQLVTEKAQDPQAGQYKWVIKGRQRSVRFTTLNISEPPDLPFTPFFSRATSPEMTFTQPEAIPQRQRRTPMGPILLLLILSILGLGLVLAWFRRRRSPRT